MVDKPTLLREAKDHLVRGRYDEARDNYKQLLGADKLDVDAMVGLARVALAKGECAEALAQTDRALAEQPECLEAKILRLVALEAAGDPSTALRDMQKLAEEHPSSCLAAYHTGRLRAACGEGAAALPWLERAAEQADRTSQRYEIQNLIGYVLQDLDRIADALNMHQQTVELSPKRAEAYVGLADALSGGGDTEAGLTMLDEAERNIGEHALLLGKQGELRARLGDLPGALQSAKRVCVRRPDDGAAWLTVAQLSMATSNFDDALEAAVRSRNAAPKTWPPHFHLGLAYDALEQSDKAEQSYRETLRYDPPSWQPANNLGLLLLARGDAEAVAEAASLFEKAAQVAGKATVQPRFNHALALAKQGDADGFRQACSKLRRADLPEPMRDKLTALEKELGDKP